MIPPPPPKNGRYTAARKATIVEAITFGKLPTERAVQIYGLSHDEVTSWLASFAENGVQGLKVGGGRQPQKPRDFRRARSYGRRKAAA
jgi:outer membrane lipoprotein SlyB